MRPLVLREIAEAVGLHESTISRVTTQKYMLTPRGIFELKYFFGSHVSTDTGGACSATAIRALIKQLVAAEDCRKPLSDHRISDILAQQGIQVARRTVAKYREAMHITGRHVEITPAIRDYVVGKLERINRHFEHMIDVNVIMTVQKLDQRIEANVHLSGKDIHVQCNDGDMYAAIDQ